MINAIYPIIKNPEPFPFYLTGIGTSDPEYHIRREDGLVSHQILYTESGAGILKVNGETLTQTAGSLFYLAPQIPHEYYPDKNEWVTCWTVFRGEFLSEQMKALGFGDHNAKNNACSDKIKRIFSRLMAAAENPVTGKEKCSELIYEYILEARKCLFYDGGGSGDILKNAVEYIENNYAEDIALEQLADIAGVSLQHFCRVFKAETGMRPLEYLAGKRISQAKLLLGNTELPVAEIGEACGYHDPAYFAAVFGKYEGISPREFRRINRGK